MSVTIFDEDNRKLYYSLWSKNPNEMRKTAYRLFPCLRNRKLDVGIILGCSDFLHHMCGREVMIDFASSLRKIVLGEIKKNYPHIVFARMMLNEQVDNELS